MAQVTLCNLCHGDGTVVCRRCEGTGLIQAPNFVVSRPNYLTRLPVRCPQCSSTVIWLYGLVLCLVFWWDWLIYDQPSPVRGSGRETCPKCNGTGLAPLPRPF